MEEQEWQRVLVERSRGREKQERRRRWKKTRKPRRERGARRRKVERYDTRTREGDLYCAVQTLAEEFGRRLRSPLKGETKGPVGEWNNRAAKLMAPLVPHFSISPAASLPPTPPFPPRFRLPPAVIPFAATPSVESYLPKQQRANNYR